MSIREAETEKPSFLLGFFLVALVLSRSVLTENTQTPHPFIIIFLSKKNIYTHVELCFSLSPSRSRGKEKKKAGRKKREKR